KSRDAMRKTLRALLDAPDADSLVVSVPTYAFRPAESVLRDHDVRDILWSRVPDSGRESHRDASEWWENVSDPDRIHSEWSVLAAKGRRTAAASSDVRS